MRRSLTKSPRLARRRSTWFISCLEAASADNSRPLRGQTLPATCRSWITTASAAGAWCLAGQSASTITETAPGIRIVVDGGELVESVTRYADRGWMLSSGEFYWQESGHAGPAQYRHNSH